MPKLYDDITSLEMFTSSKPTELALKNTTACCWTKETAALAVEVKERLVLYMLTTHIEPGSFVAYSVQHVTQLLEKSKTTPISLQTLQAISFLLQQFQASAESKLRK